MARAEVVYVEGLPASGKTSLIGRLAICQPNIFNHVPEYVDSAAAHEALAGDDETYFIRNDEEKYRLARNSELPCLVDRGHLSTILYQRAHRRLFGYQPVDTDSWYQSILDRGMLPDAYIHLDSDPVTSLKRRPPATDWVNVWDYPEALAYARKGYADLMALQENDVPVLRLQADRMNFPEIDREVKAFLTADVISGAGV